MLLAAAGCQRSAALCTPSAGCFDAAEPDIGKAMPLDAAVVDLLPSVDLLPHVPGWTESLTVSPGGAMMGIAQGIVEVWAGGGGATAGFWRTEDNGVTWTRHLFPEESFHFGDFARTASGRFFIGGETEGFTHPMWFSDDVGVTWQSANSPTLRGNAAQILTAAGTSVYAFAGDGSLTGLLRSVDNGKTWDVTQSLPYRGVVEALHASVDGRLWLGTGETGGYTVFVSGDKGDTWQPVPFFRDLDNCDDATSIQSAGETVFVMCYRNLGISLPHRLYRGMTSGNGFAEITPDTSESVALFVLSDQVLWCGSSGGLLYFSDTAGDHWTEIDIPASLEGFRDYGPIWSAAGPDDFCCRRSETDPLGRSETDPPSGSSSVGSTVDLFRLRIGKNQIVGCGLEARGLSWGRAVCGPSPGKARERVPLAV